MLLLLLKMESLYAIAPMAIQQTQEVVWILFLRKIIAAAKQVDTSDIISVEFEIDISRPLLSHLGRFPQMDAQAFITVLTHKNM